MTSAVGHGYEKSGKRHKMERLGYVCAQNKDKYSELGHSGRIKPV